MASQKMRIFSSALMACALPGRSSLPAGAALVTGLALDVILIPPYDAVGAAVASSVGLFVGAAVGLVLYRRVERFGLAEIVPRTADVLGIVSRLSRPISRARRSSPAA